MNTDTATPDTATTTTAADTAAGSYCESVIALLNTLVRGGQGSLVFDFGSGTTTRAVVPFSGPDATMTVLPDTVIDALENGWRVAVHPALVSASHPYDAVTLSALFVTWRPALVGGYRATPEATSRILDGLGGFPLTPAWLVDAGNEVTAFYALTDPLNDMVCARQLQYRLAERLGGETGDVSSPSARGYWIRGRDTEPGARLVPACDPLALVTIAGVMRPGTPRGSFVRIEPVEPRAYTLAEIERALTPPVEPTETDTPRKRGPRAS